MQPRTSEDLLVVRTGPERVEGIAIRFDSLRGLVADYFPKTTGITDEALCLARSHPGVIAVEGNGGVGTRVRFTCANGEALYELTGRMSLSTGAPGYVAELRNSVAKVAGQHTPVRTFTHLRDFDWPDYAALTDDFLTETVHLVRNGDSVTVSADGVTAVYRLILPHPTRRDARIAERLKLESRDGIVVTLPVASTRSLTVS